MVGSAQEFCVLRGYLTYKKTHPPLGPPYEPRHGPSVGSYGVAVSYKRGTPVGAAGGHGNPEAAKTRDEKKPPPPRIEPLTSLW